MDFYVIENKVYIKCYLEMENVSNEMKNFKLTAIMPQDVLGGLLKDKNVPGYNIVLKDYETGLGDITEMEISSRIGSNEFSLDKNSKKHFVVVFIGDFSKTHQKQNRNLPKIVITNDN